VFSLEEDVDGKGRDAENGGEGNEPTQSLDVRGENVVSDICGDELIDGHHQDHLWMESIRIFGYKI